METEIKRAAFSYVLLHEHRSPNSKITSSAFHPMGDKVYFGLSDGQIEEHKITSGDRLILSAKKVVSGKPLLELCVMEAARCLAVLADGRVLLLDLENFNSTPLSGPKAVTALALQSGAETPQYLAVALRTSKRTIKLLIYQVFASTSSPGPPALCVFKKDLKQPEAVKALTWVKSNLILCTSVGYLLYRPQDGSAGPLLSLPGDAIPHTNVYSLPGGQAAMILMDQAGVIVGSDGQPITSALTFPSEPLAIATAGIFALAICMEAVHVYDLSSSVLVQSLQFPEGQSPAADQKLLVSTDKAGSKIIIAGFRKVWLYLPVSLEDQTRQLLKRQKYSAALELASRSSATGIASWAQTAFAQAGLMLLHEGLFTEAMDAFARCDVSVLQPREVFPLFPEIMHPWGIEPTGKKYWGLHGPLPSIDNIIALTRVGGTQASNAIQHEGEVAVTNYLKKVSRQEGLEAVDGVHTLAAFLMSKYGMTTDLNKFLELPNKVRLSSIERQLTADGNCHALALLYRSSGQAARALNIWQVLATRDAESSHGASKGVSCEKAMHEALMHFTHLICDVELIDDSTALQYLAWLYETSPKDALHVIKARSFEDSRVLAILRGSNEAWQYLEYLVWEGHTTEPAQHTELAVLLLQKILSMLPTADLRKTPHERARSFNCTEDVNRLRFKLQKVLHKSDIYDRKLLWQQLSPTDLFEEQVLLLKKVNNYNAALEILALVLEDVQQAQALCEELGSMEAYLFLLEMLLHPPDGRSPLYADACRLLASQGAELDPMEVVETLSEEMPLSYATEIFARMIRERIHRHRHYLLVRNLQRSLNLSVSVAKAEIMSKHIVMRQDKVCHACHSRLSNRMFAAYPNGRLACFGCLKKLSCADS